MAKSVSVSMSAERIVFRGSPVALLRVKAEIVRIVGSPNVRTIDGTSFDVAKTFADRLGEYLPEADEAVAGLLASVEAHRLARQEVAHIMQTEEEVGGRWDAVLDPHQKTAVRAMIVPGLRGLCLFDEQGSGKTVMTLAAFDLLCQRSEINLMVVVCPKSMLAEWSKDAERLMPGSYRFVIVEGDPTKKWQTVLGKTDVLVIGYEAVDGLLTALSGVCDAHKTLLVADESFYAKNPEAVRSRALRELRTHCRRCFVLCGTPAPNGAEDLVHQFDLADDGYTFSDVPTDDSEAVRSAVESRGTYIRRLKKDTLPFLPPKEFRLVRVPLFGRQARLYEQVRNDLIVWLKGMDNRSFQKNYTDYLVRRSDLLQVCACPSAVDPLLTDPHAKLRAVDELVEEMMRDEGRKVILWSFYRVSVKELFERFSRFGAVVVDGSISNGERGSAVVRFQTDPTIRIFVGNPAACGAGVTLTAAADAVYISFSNQAAHFLQSLDRIHRRGQTAKEVNYHLLVCEHTLEEAEITRLRQKEIAQGDLLGDPEQGPMSIDEALAELSRHPDVP